MKKLMIAVLAVTGSRLPSADPEACLRQFAFHTETAR